VKEKNNLRAMEGALGWVESHHGGVQVTQTAEGPWRLLRTRRRLRRDRRRGNGKLNHSLSQSADERKKARGNGKFQGGGLEKRMKECSVDIALAIQLILCGKGYGSPQLRRKGKKNLSRKLGNQCTPKGGEGGPACTQFEKEKGLLVYYMLGIKALPKGVRGDGKT